MKSIAISKEGGRPHNEDYVFADDGTRLYIVADGLGGHASGKVASESAVKAVQKVLLKEDPGKVLADIKEMRNEADRWKAFITYAIRRANARILNRRSETGNDMKTTLTVVKVGDRGKGYLGHVGDGRVYRVSQDGSISLLTQEHRKGDYLTKSLGAERLIQPDVFDFQFENSDALLICTDGFWSFVSEEKIAEVILHQPICHLEEALYRQAELGGSDDNVSFIVIEQEGFVAALNKRRVTELEQVLSVNPDDLASRRELILFCDEIGDYRGLVKDVNSYISKIPTDGEVLKVAANAFQTLNDLESCKNILEKLYNLDPEDKQTQKALTEVKPKIRDPWPQTCTGNISRTSRRISRQESCLPIRYWTRGRSGKPGRP